MDTNLWYNANGNRHDAGHQHGRPVLQRDQRHRAHLQGRPPLGCHARTRRLSTDYDYSKGRSDRASRSRRAAQAGGDLLFPTTTSTNFPHGSVPELPAGLQRHDDLEDPVQLPPDKNVTFSLLYWHQKFDQADWAYDGLAPYMLPGSACTRQRPARWRTSTRCSIRAPTGRCSSTPACRTTRATSSGCRSPIGSSGNQGRGTRDWGRGTGN